jgi:hypothetical protein
MLINIGFYFIEFLVCYFSFVITVFLVLDNFCVSGVEDGW